MGIRMKLLVSNSDVNSRFMLTGGSSHVDRCCTGILMALQKCRIPRSSLQFGYTSLVVFFLRIDAAQVYKYLDGSAKVPNPKIFLIS